MLRRLKKHLVPHRGNHHRPHLLRKQATRAIILGCIVFEFVLWMTLTFNLIGSIPFTASILPGVLSTLTNEQRIEGHLANLKTNPLLDEAATLKAQDMAEKGYFAHTSPEGKTPWYWLNKVGYNYDYAGENLAINFSDSADVTTAWMNSPTHRANIEKAAYTEIGTGIATGMYEGAETTFVAQVYGRPASTKSDSIERESLSAVPAKKSVKVATVTAANPKTSQTPTEPTIVFEQPETSAQSSATPGSPEILGATNNASDNPSGASATTSSAPTEQVSAGFLTMLTKWLTSPRQLVNVLFLAIGIVVTIVAIITIIVRLRKKQHPDLIINALIVIAVLLGLYFLNSYWAKTQITQTSSYTEFSAT